MILWLKKDAGVKGQKENLKHKQKLQNKMRGFFIPFFYSGLAGPLVKIG